MPLVILIEGNIAAGKSTLARELCMRLDMRLFEEPVEDNPYLVDFYSDPKAYAAKMQSWLLNLRYKTYIEALEYIKSTGRGVVLDRSVWSDCVFADNCHNDGLMTDEEYEAYWNERSSLLAGLRKPDLCIYLDASPSVCHTRIVEIRGRECEQNISIDYLQGLDKCYKTWLERMKQLGVDVLNIDRNRFLREADQKILDKVLGMSSNILRRQDGTGIRDHPDEFASLVFDE